MRIFAGIILFICLLLGQTPEAFAVKTIKIAFSNIPDHPQGQAFAKFKKDLEEKSNGEFKVELIDSGKFGNPDSIVQGLQMGTLQMGAESTSNFSVFAPQLMLFDMPYLIPDYESADVILDGPIGQDLAKSLEKNGCKGLGFMELGFRQLFSTRPVHNLADNKGLKVRATPSKAHIAILRSLGMNPTPMAWGEVYTALQQKTIDAIDVDMNLGWFWRFPEIAKFLTLSKHFYTPHLVLMSQRFWNTLSQEEQKLIQETMQDAIAFERAKSRANENEFIEKIKNDPVMEVIELSPEEMQAWQKAASVVPGEFSKTISPELLKRVSDSIAAAKSAKKQ